MSDSKGSSTVSLIEQFSQAIQNVKQRITGYNEQVQQYKQGVNSEADRLRELVERLRACLDGLKTLKQSHDGFVTRINIISQNIQTERMRAEQDEQESNDRNCHDKLNQIYKQFQELETTLSEMNTDFTNNIAEQVNNLGGVIDELCKEGDGISNGLQNANTDVDTSIKEIEELQNSKYEADMEAVPSNPNDPNSPPLRGWKMGYESNHGNRVYYYKEDGSEFKDIGGNMVTSTYTHPSDLDGGSFKGGWQSADKLKSLSRTHPIRSLNKKTKKKRKTKKKKRTRGKRYKKKKSKKKRR